MSYLKTNAHLCSFFLQVVKVGKYLELTIIECKLNEFLVRKV